MFELAERIVSTFERQNRKMLAFVLSFIASNATSSLFVHNRNVDPCTYWLTVFDYSHRSMVTTNFQLVHQEKYDFMLEPRSAGIKFMYKSI